MKIRNVQVTRGHALTLIVLCMLVSGVLTVIKHPMIDAVKTQLLFTFFSGTFVPVIVDWLREPVVS